MQFSFPDYWLWWSETVGCKIIAILTFRDVSTARDSSLNTAAEFSITNILICLLLTSYIMLSILFICSFFQFNSCILNFVHSFKFSIFTLLNSPLIKKVIQRKWIQIHTHSYSLKMCYKGSCNALLVKVNQIGSITETIRAVILAKKVPSRSLLIHSLTQAPTLSHSCTLFLSLTHINTHSITHTRTAGESWPLTVVAKLRTTTSLTSQLVCALARYNCDNCYLCCLLL